MGTVAAILFTLPHGIRRRPDRGCASNLCTASVCVDETPARAQWGIKHPQCGRFRRLPPPDDAEVESIVRTTAGGIFRLLQRRGLGADADPDQADPVTRDEGLMAALYSASVRGRIATGPRAGQEVMRFGGLSLHANVAVPPGDRQRLERLCRYVARPPVAKERLKRLPDGRLMYELRHPWRDGTTHVAFLPLELVEKLAALVPPPRVNLVRYHGVLAPAARHRAEVVPVIEKSGGAR
jgi:hypothetical protein